MDRRDQLNAKIALAAASIVLIAVLCFGAVEIWSSALAEAAVFTLFLIWLVLAAGDHRKEREGKSQEFAMLIALFSLVGYAAIQMLPLPHLVLHALSPKAFDLYAFYTLDQNPAMHISLSPHNTELEFMRMLTYSLFFILFMFSVKDMRTLEKVMTVFSCFGFGLAVFALLQKATAGGMIYWLRETGGGVPFGPFVNRNHYAGFIGMILPLALGIAFTRKTPAKQILFGFFSLIMTVSLFLSLSRGGIISFFAGISLFALFILWNTFKAKKIWALAAFIFTLFLYLIYLGIDPIINRFYQADLTGNARLAVWSYTLQAFQDFPLAGSGLGTFIHVFQLYSPEPVISLYDHAHNDYLEFLLETGLIGASILLVFIYCFFRSAVRGSWDGRTGIVRISLFSSITALAVHSIFDFNLHIPSNALMLAAVCGMAVAAAKFAHTAAAGDEEKQETMERQRQRE